MKKSADVLDLTVITLAEGKNVGKVKEVVIDTDKRALAGFLIQSGDWYRINGLPYESVQSIGNDAIIVENSAAVIDASATDKMDELMAKHSPVKNYTIYTKTGKTIGAVKEIVFDQDSGKLLNLEIETSDKGASEISIDSVITFGQNILIVDMDVSLEKSKKKVKEDLKTPVTPDDSKETPEESKIETAESVPVQEAEPALSVESNVDTAAALESVDTADTVETIDIAVLAAEDSQNIAEKTQKEADDNHEETTDGKKQKSSISDIFANRQAQLLIGKKLIRDITAENGEVIATEGDVVSEDIIKNAISNKKLVQLMVSVQGKG